MEKTYQISGMTCAGCKASVQKHLTSAEKVKQAIVHLETQEAVLSLTADVSVGELQQLLPEKYHISEKFHTVQEPPEAGVLKTKSKWKQLYPLFLIFAYLFISSSLLQGRDGHWRGFMFDFMGLFYVVFSFFKFLDFKGFPTSFAMYDPLAKRLPLYAWIYPFLEAALGLLFLMRIQIFMALCMTLFILGLTTIGVAQSLFNKKKIRCACLGTALKLPMTEATLIENIIMIGMASSLLINGYS